MLEDRVTDFDRLAEQEAEEVRTAEPDTLVHVIHLVPNAPLQRIFYEVYRDRAAFEWHENQPVMKRFAADRRSCVLATNVIELRLKYAKVAPLRLRLPRAGAARGRRPGTPRAQRPPPAAARPARPGQLPSSWPPVRGWLGCQPRARITLLAKPGCHLCDDARAMIERVAVDLGVGWEERDITASAADMRDYWEKIPVALVDGVQVDFWWVNEDRLRAALG